MLKRFVILAFFSLLFTGIVVALQLPFETASVGRIQGDSFDDLENALDANSITVNGADYYTGQYATGTSFASQNSATATYNVLTNAFQTNNVALHSRPYWHFAGIISNKVQKNRALILQSKGVVKDSKVRAFDGLTTPQEGQQITESMLNQATPLSAIPLDFAIEGSNLVISDVDFAGTYLPKMGKADSFSSQLAGKAGALVATNGVSNPAFVKAFICSLVLQSKSFGQNGYYKFDSLGDRFRNARNNLALFGSGTAAASASDFSLYGLPFIKVNSKSLSPEFLRGVCGDFSQYNVYPMSQSLSVQEFSAQGNAEVYQKELSLDFSDYSVSSGAGFAIIDVNGAMQEFSEGDLVLPFAVSEVEFPIGTTISAVEIASKSNPITLDLNSLPIVAQGNLAKRFCSENSSDASAEFLQKYSENKVSVVAKVHPVEVADCNIGLFRLYRDIVLQVSYTPSSPLLLKEVSAKTEAFPGDVIDVNVLSENITLAPSNGTLRIMDGNEVVAQRQVSIPAGTHSFETIPVQLGDDEGFYDYRVEFDQNGAAQTSSSFKVDAQVLKVDVDFAGSKKFYDDFESLPFDKKWSVQQINFSGNEDKSLVLGQSDGSLKAFSHAALTAGNVGLSTLVEGNVMSKEGLAVFDDYLSQAAQIGESINLNDYGSSPYACRVAFDDYYTGPRIFQSDGGNIVISFSGLVTDDAQQESCRTVWDAYRAQNAGYFLFVNEVERPLGKDIYPMAQCGSSHCTYAHTYNIELDHSLLKPGYNEIEVVHRAPDNRTISRFKIFVEPQNCSGPEISTLKDRGVCAGNIRFSIHELPLTIVFAPESGVQLLGSDVEPLDFSGAYIIDKQDNNTLKWKKDAAENWNRMDVSNWDKEKLGFAFYTLSQYYYDSAPKKITMKGKAFAKISDGTNSAVFVEGELNYSAPAPAYQNYNVRSGFIVSEIMRPYLESARGSSIATLNLENKSSHNIPVHAEYVLGDVNGVISSGEMDATAKPGTSSVTFQLEDLKGPQKTYSLSIGAFYNNNAKFVGTNFSGNSAPRIDSPAHIQVHAYRTLKFDYSVFDSDGDRLDINFDAPFLDADNSWIPDENDIGTKEIFISASDGFEKSEKKIIIDVLPPKIECSADLDCGDAITTDPRVCVAGKLYAEQKIPFCTNAGQYNSFCSVRDYNLEYGYCGFNETLADGTGVKTLRFSSAGEKSYGIELPRKAKVTHAVLEVSGKAPQVSCFNPVQSFDSQNSTAQKYNFANGTKFVGLPLGPEILAASRETTSDFLEGFPDVKFTTEQRGIPSNMSIYGFCIDMGGGFKYMHLSAYCDGVANYTTWTNNFVSQCSPARAWMGGGFTMPTSEPSMTDFCVWSASEHNIHVTQNVNTAYCRSFGSWSGIGDPGSPAFRAYIQQFQTGKELYLGSVPFEAKQASFLATEDLRSQKIDYYVTSDGANWKTIGNNSSIGFTPEDATGQFNWKAVLSTVDPAATPRLIDANLCVETYGTPRAMAARVGATIFALPSEREFGGEIDITEALNKYIESQPFREGNVTIPVAFSAGSEGIISLQGISYAYDVKYNTAPFMEPIEMQYATSGEPFSLQLHATDLEGDKITYSDDSQLFDINSESGLISFTPAKADAGLHQITITASDGNLFSSAIFTLDIETAQEPAKACDTNISDGLVAHYCFEDTYEDSSVNKNNGVAHNGVNIETLSGGNKVARFNGLDGYIEAPDSNSLRFNQGTISFWISRDVNNSPIGGIIRKGLNATNEYYIDLRYGDTFKSWNSGFDPTGGSWSCEPEFGKLPIDLDYHHVVQVRRANSLSFYIDGVLVLQSECPITTYYDGTQSPVRSNPLWIGTNYPPQMYRMFSGALDEIMLYNRPLSETEIKNLYSEQQEKFREKLKPLPLPLRVEAAEIESAGDIATNGAASNPDTSETDAKVPELDGNAVLVDGAISSEEEVLADENFDFDENTWNSDVALSEAER